MVHDRAFLGAQLRPRQGIAAGLLAGSVMLVLWAVLLQVVGPGARRLLGVIASTLLGGNAADGGSAADGDWLPLLVGVLLHLAVSILLGLLFASSLDRIGRRETLVVSTFFGFTIWVVAAFIVGSWFSEAIVALLRAWPGLLACLSFGFVLGLFAIARGAAPPTLSPD
jgi:hypothetical protein